MLIHDHLQFMSKEEEKEDQRARKNTPYLLPLMIEGMDDERGEWKYHYDSSWTWVCLL